LKIQIQLFVLKAIFNLNDIIIPALLCRNHPYRSRHCPTGCKWHSESGNRRFQPITEKNNKNHENPKTKMTLFTFERVGSFSESSVDRKSL
jgi:hypothetical protein